MKLLYRCLSWYDAHWRRTHKVERFDDLLSFSLDNYHGEQRIMADGTRIEPGDPLAIIHFNRECFSNPSGDARQNARNALRFRRLMMSSLRHLAEAVQGNGKFAGIKAFHGISWLPPHGEKLGFVIEPVPDTTINRIRRLYFTVLLKTFFPHLLLQGNNRIEPHAYWLTPRTLLNNFALDVQAKDHEIYQPKSPLIVDTNPPTAAVTHLQGSSAW